MVRISSKAVENGSCLAIQDDIARYRSDSFVAVYESRVIRPEAAASPEMFATLCFDSADIG